MAPIYPLPKRDKDTSGCVPGVSLLLSMLSICPSPMSHETCLYPIQLNRMVDMNPNNYGLCQNPMEKSSGRGQANQWASCEWMTWMPQVCPEIRTLICALIWSRALGWKAEKPVAFQNKNCRCSHRQKLCCFCKP